ncbi:AsmA-like C-terminal region-containing protein [Lewinella sp. 4G2]|uniref:AsmA-like C-terminal region-containing protein n=1 Tax=Lewinella sp. 4G2 TaxID=1803372 RepID=UPI000A8DE26D|nr:AsmA-like C-terminal region-containing protein [Lewinella sp. 4G2]
MKFLKRLLIALVLIVVLGVAALLAAPILFKEQIVDNVRKSTNKMVDAKVDFSDIDVSFLRSFPDVSARIYDLEVVGIDTFAGLPLLAADEVTVDLGFWSVVGNDGSFNVDAVALERPSVNLLVVNSTLANYLITPTGEATSPEEEATSATFLVNLDHYEIHDGTFVYDDRTTDTYIKIEGLETTGDGDFTASIFDLDTYSEMDHLTLKQGGVTYLNRVAATADAIVNVDLDNQLYTFRENTIRLNALDLTFDGSIQLAENEDILFDLSYQAPANDFRQLWSMIPTAYVEGYSSVQATGLFTLNGTVKGPFNSTTEKYPAFTVSTNIENGSVQYPGRPVGITGIDAKVDVNSPSKDLDRLRVDIPRFNFNLGGDPFAGSFKLTTPLSDPTVDATVKGNLDLDKWAQAIPLEGISQLGGKIIADVVLQNVSQSLIDAGDYAQVNMGGDLEIIDFVYVADGTPDVKIPSAKADFTPQAINIPSFAATLGRSDLAGSASITTPLAYFNPEETMRGDVKFTSNYFDVDEWMAPETDHLAASPAELVEAGVPATEEDVFDRFDFDVDASIAQLNYGTYRPKGIRAVGNVKPNKMTLATAEATLGQSAFSASGDVTNLFDYTFADGVLGGDLTVQSEYIDLADFMEEEAASQNGSSSSVSEEGAAIPIPDNINLAVNLRADRVKYDDIDLSNMVGRLVMAEGQAVIEDGKTDLFGGRMDFAGAYDTSEPGDPGFRFHYDMSAIDFNQAFEKLNSFAALAPIGKYIQGKFNTDLVLEGKLGEDLFPKLSFLDAKGLFQTFNAQLAGIQPLEKVGNALNVKELKNSTLLKDVMTVFKIEDGTVEVEPFDLSVAGIQMNVAGRHGLDTDMAYNLKAAIPREMIEGNIVTGTAVAALDQLAGQASKLGLNIAPGDVLNVNINLTGTMADPKVKFQLLGTDGTAAANPGEAIVDAAKERLNQELEDRKQQAQAEVDKKVEEVRQQAQEEADKLKGEATARAQAMQDSIKRAAEARAALLQEEARKKLAAQIDSARLDSLRNLLPEDVRNPADRIKDELGKFNPFKKKKKN